MQNGIVIKYIFTRWNGNEIKWPPHVHKYPIKDAILTIKYFNNSSDIKYYKYPKYATSVDINVAFFVLANERTWPLNSWWSTSE